MLFPAIEDFAPKYFYDHNLKCPILFNTDLGPNQQKKKIGCAAVLLA